MEPVNSVCYSVRIQEQSSSKERTIFEQSVQRLEKKYEKSLDVSNNSILNLLENALNSMKNFVTALSLFLKNFTAPVNSVANVVNKLFFHVTNKNPKKQASFVSLLNSSRKNTDWKKFFSNDIGNYSELVEELIFEMHKKNRLGPIV